VFVKEENISFTPLENVTNVISLEKLVMNELDILKRLDKIDINKSPGPDGIHPRISYEVRHEIADVLKIIFINSLQNHVVPVDWRAGNISPIFKKGKKTDASYYRPISLTSIVCKLFESIIRDHIVHFLLLIHLVASNTVLLRVDQQFYKC